MSLENEELLEDLNTYAQVHGFITEMAQGLGFTETLSCLEAMHRRFQDGEYLTPDLMARLALDMKQDYLRETFDDLQGHKIAEQLVRQGVSRKLEKGAKLQSLELTNPKFAYSNAVLGPLRELVDDAYLKKIEPQATNMLDLFGLLIKLESSFDLVREYVENYHPAQGQEEKRKLAVLIHRYLAYARTYQDRLGLERADLWFIARSISHGWFFCEKNTVSFLLETGTKDLEYTLHMSDLRTIYDVNTVKTLFIPLMDLFTTYFEYFVKEVGQS